MSSNKGNMRAADRLFEPTARVFDYCIPIAESMIDAAEEPGWFREHLSAHIQDFNYELPSKLLLILALALYLSHQEQDVPRLKSIRSKIKAERSRLLKASVGVQQLRDFRLELLGMQCGVPSSKFDGSVELATADPIDEMVRAIDRFVVRLDACEIPPNVGGNRPSRLSYAVGLLQQIVDRYTPALTPEEREALCHHLFDPVREQLGHHSGSPDAEPDEMPRYSDLLTKGSRAARRSKRTSGPILG
jgi:hypothetical protein